MIHHPKYHESGRPECKVLEEKEGAWEVFEDVDELLLQDQKHPTKCLFEWLENFGMILGLLTYFVINAM